MHSNKISYKANAALPMYTIVAASTNHNEVKLATSGTDLIKGITSDVDVKQGNLVDVQHYGVTKVRCGSVIKDGEAFTADSEGRAVKAKDGDNIAGIMLEDGAKDEICYCNIVLQRAVAPTRDETPPNTAPSQG